jgi:hypothetical protein
MAVNYRAHAEAAEAVCQTQFEKIVLNKQQEMARPQVRLFHTVSESMVFFNACATTNDAPPVAKALNKLLSSSALRNFAATRGPGSKITHSKNIIPSQVAVCAMK